MAEPLKNIIVVRVTRKDGISNRVVQTPLSTPMTRPTAMQASTASKGAQALPAR